MLFGVGIEICGSNISLFPNAVKNGINRCSHIKIHLFDHILMLGKHMRCDLFVGIKEMLEDDVGGILYEVIIKISKSSGVLHIYSCDYLRPL